MTDGRQGLRLAMVMCVAGIVAACGAGGTGGGGGTPTGGAPGSYCNTKYNSQGCLVSMRTECVALAASATPDAGEWKDLGSCTSPQYCAQEVSPTDPAKKVAICKDPAVQTTDTVTSGDGTTTGGDTKGPTVAEMKACMQSKCSTEWMACKADSAGCGLMASCIEKCTDEACTDACPKPPENNAQAFAVGMCMISKGCVPSEPDKPVCGDSKCESGETNSSCAKDCPAAVPTCGDGKCDQGETNATCSKDCSATGPKCGDGKCEGTENIEMCPQDCKSTAPVCGNGKCEPPTENIEMCPKDCKATGPVCGNGTCESGETQASCPSDCKPLTTAKCGDAKCDSGETTTCPMDCASQYNATFLCGISKCGSQWNTCLNDSKCKGLFNCAVQCQCDEGCIQECAGGMESNSAVIGMVTCSSNAQCPNPCPTGGPVCGNGKCESGETKTSCSKDCGSSSPVCGNGTCEAGETKTSCAKDCSTTTGHPCDASCGGKAPSGCYCDAECMNAGDCCDASGAPAGKSCTGSTCAACQAP